MFNTYNYSTEVAPSYPETIKEFKAPTDESIRLYKELEEKAHQNLVAKAPTQENDFKCYAHWFIDNIGNDEIICVDFNINEKPHSLKIELDRFQHRKPEEKAKKVQEEIQSYLAREISIDVFEKLSENRQFLHSLQYT